MLKRKEKTFSAKEKRRVLCVMSYIFVQCDSEKSKEKWRKKLKENRKKDERKSKEE